MIRRFAALAALAVAFAGTPASQQPPQAPPAQPSTTPPPGNDQSLRKLGPDEIPPNLSFYAVDPLYLAVYSGETGAEIDKVDWIERGEVTDWADRSGNRSSRHMMGVAYLDGKRQPCWPSVAHTG